ncbi:MAG: LysR substrate-binding domain-containing protein [Pseudomonadota bacterium]
MNERQITAFRHVMRLGSVTAAARAMRVSQPAVSRHIADLETDLGFPLFERRSGKLHPLPEAQTLEREVDRMFYGLDRLRAFAREMRGMAHAQISIASLPMASFRILPRVVSSFLAKHPGIRVTHNVYTSARIADLVGAGQADFGIAQLPPGRADVRRLAGWRCPCVVVLPAGHELGEAPLLTPEDLADVPLIALAHQTVTAAFLTERFSQAGIAPKIIAESQPSYAACGMVAEGLGATVVDPFTPSIFPEGVLTTVPFEPSIPFDVYLIGHPERAPSRAVQAMIGLVEEEFDRAAGADLRLKAGR